MCSLCGMHVEENAGYHPYAACLMFQQCRNGNTVDSNLKAVVEYGMKAQEKGLSLDEAMKNISSVISNQEG